MARTRVAVHDAQLARVRALIAAAILTLAAMVVVPPDAPAVPRASSGVTVDPTVEAAIAETGEADVIVRILPGVELEVAEVIASTGGSIDRYLPIADTVTATVTDAALTALEVRADLVVSVALDGPVRLLHDAPDGSFYSDWSFGSTVGAEELHAQGLDGSGVGVALVDTGVNEVGDLEGRVVHGVDLSGEGDGVDRFGHGTFVAGVVAGDGAASDGAHSGVAPGARLVSIKIAGEDGVSDVSQLLAAMQWAVSFKDAHDIEVLNLPIGTDSTQPWTIDPLNYAVQQVWDAGIVVVVAAGNRGPDAGTILKPADDPFVITVGATDFMSTVERHDDIVPDFSSRGPTAAGIVKPDLVAPGAHVIGLRAPGSTVDQLAPEARVDEHYFRGSGTSFSAGVVSGAVALLKQAHPDWTPDQVKGALLASAAPGPVGDPNVDGAGALDVVAAVALDDPPVTNEGLERGTGLGSIGESRGQMVVEVVRHDGSRRVLDRDSQRTVTGRPFDRAQFLGWNWQGWNWQHSQWAGWNWQGWNWQGWNWQGWNWQGWNWQGWNWQGTNWQ